MDEIEVSLVGLLPVKAIKISRLQSEKTIEKEIEELGEIV